MLDMFTNYFSPEDLSTLRSFQGSTLLRVNYVIWRNIAKPHDIMEVLEWIDLQFAEGGRLSITAGEESLGLELEDLNFGLEQTKVLQQFRGQVELEMIDMTDSPTWAGLAGQQLVAIGLMAHDRNQHPNKMIQFEFEDSMVDLAVQDEGLLVQRT
ncbi:hypothetical protein [Pontibacter sp. G13]|uniref:hypothetical protein n=1 Tax=Pontibacter sp. G13 TaxID=3074898 RepID=UPI00288C306E|nr:hypothetical protein [Pontibacter sp. G13]WNJ19395.1 hypothetical protein RJD25_02785 [Pontibacter sp. G13]